MTPLDTASPFVLLDDARPMGAGPSRLYRGLIAEVRAESLDDVEPALDQLRALSRDGAYLAGYIGYEAGLALEGRFSTLPAPMRGGEGPLLWFGAFKDLDMLARDRVPDLLGDPAAAWLGAPRPRIMRETYQAKVREILDLIAAGDIYQANFSFRADVPFSGAPLALYARLRAASDAGWGGVLFDGERWLLSCSPEMFFTLTGDQLVSRPMKGTADAASDPALLKDDRKQRAENLMIVDLIRNDLSRVAVPGSVAVPALFEVETYPTVLQMTSTVTAQLAPDHDAIDVLKALFPCGSITGAPKIRAMEIIADCEDDARGPYTGALGWIDPGGDAAFNVAIRTLMIEPGQGAGVLGLGSAIVADSSAPDEWRECLAKGSFVTAAVPRFDLIETMRFDAHEGLVDLERHLARLKASAEHFGFSFDRHALRNELQAATFRLRTDHKVRLRLSPSGAVALEVRAMDENPESAEVALTPLPVSSDDFRLRHKTSDRDFYNKSRAASGCFEALFVDTEGYLTEGSFTNLFVPRDGVLITPPVSRGLLAGVLRERLIEEGRAIEGDLRPTDLSDRFFIGNALRGLISVRLVAGANPTGL